jgi:exoribonuclease R
MEYLNKQIYGILKLNSKTIYGINKNSVIREFIPIYPKIQNKILVSTKKPFQPTNVMGICKLDSFKNNMYYGSMSEYFGDLGDELNEETFMKRIASDGWKKISYKLTEETDMIQTLENNIYSIDPIGCIDIDDAIHIEEFNDYYQIGIHIADVSYYIEEKSNIDLEIQKRAETIYLPNETIHMLPENLMKLCSLTQDKLSRVVSVIFKISKDNYKVIQYDIQRNVIRPINLSYDEAKILIKNKSNTELELLYEIAKHLYPFQDEIYDIHKMVEKYMILANNYVAIHISINKEYILRIHNGLNDSNINDKDDTNDINDIIYEKHKLINLEKAEYVLINDLYEGSTMHNLLNIKYTHFTSPIRRYADILVHRLLFKPIVLDNKIIQNLNDKHSHYHKWTNYINAYQLLKLEDTLFEINAYIINLEPFVIYIKKYNLILYHTIVSDKIKDLFEIQIENNKMKIINKNNDIIELKLYQKIKILISITLHKWNKLNIQLIDPNIQFLFYDDY